MKDRSMFRIGLLASTMLTTSLLVPAAFAAPVPSTATQEVTTQRLLKADQEPQNWLQGNKDYGAHRYSELDQINKNNVKDLHVAFMVALAYPPATTKIPMMGYQSTPLVDDGAMYVVDGWGTVYRIDVRDPGNAKIAWVMDPGT